MRRKYSPAFVKSLLDAEAKGPVFIGTPEEAMACLRAPEVKMTTKGKSFTRRTHAPAVGTPDGLRRKIAVGFDPSDFDRISGLAQKNGIGFQEQVRALCKAALSSTTAGRDRS